VVVVDVGVGFPRDEAKAGLFGFPWLLVLFALAWWAALFGFIAFDRWSFGLGPRPLPLLMVFSSAPLGASTGSDLSNMKVHARGARRAGNRRAGKVFQGEPSDVVSGVCED
jgi:hypothetical protein